MIFLLSAVTEGDASSPHGTTCTQHQINGAGNTTATINSKSPLLNTSIEMNNEGLTRHQLDLISQIMQQTKNSNGQKTTTLQRPRTWNMQVRQSYRFQSIPCIGNILRLGNPKVAQIFDTQSAL